MFDAQACFCHGIVQKVISESVQGKKTVLVKQQVI